MIEFKTKMISEKRCSTIAVEDRIEARGCFSDRTVKVTRLMFIGLAAMSISSADATRVPRGPSGPSGNNMNADGSCSASENGVTTSAGIDSCTEGLTQPGCMSADEPTNGVSTVSSGSRSSAAFSDTVLSQRIEMFGVQLFNTLRHNNMDSNVFIAPYSIYIAFGMLMAGATKKDQSYKEITTTMKVNEFTGADDTAFHAAMLRSQVEARVAGFNPINSIWIRKEKQLRPSESFRSVQEEFYNASSHMVDFGLDPEGARLQINDWIASKTEQRIRDLLPEGSIDDSTFSVLCNAIYFKEKWSEEFHIKSSLTDFHLPDDRGVKKVKYISSDSDGLRYFFDEKLNADIVFVPYAKAGAAAVVIVPRERNGLSTMKLHDDTISSAFSRSRRKFVEIILPKFKSETAAELKSPLMDMGLKRIFDCDLAALLGLSGIYFFDRIAALPLYVSAVFHGVFVAVDEVGTEAAAATAIVTGVPTSECVYPPLFATIVADHPFFFGIVNILPDEKTINTVFLGAMNNPTE